MNKYIFLLIGCPDLTKSSNFYSDLAEEFSSHGNEVTIITAANNNQKEGVYWEKGIRMIRVKTINSVGVKSVLKKGLSLVSLSLFYYRAFHKYISKEKFDVVFLPTPPISLINVALHIKKKCKSKLYLILRDIHPECDSRSGYYKDNLFYKLIYRFLYSRAQKAYKHSDFIGCMSPGNIELVKELAPKIDFSKIVLLPNWLKRREQEANESVRVKYNLEGKFVSVFGGTIGKAQDVECILKLADRYKDFKKVVFLIIGKGIKKDWLQNEVLRQQLKNVVFIDYMPREDYESVLSTADVGLVLLDPNYGVPTCPSKVISYMAKKVPVLAMINKNSDYGSYYINIPNCGLWSAGDDDKMFENFELLRNDRNYRHNLGESGYSYYLNHFTSEKAYENIINQINVK